MTIGIDGNEANVENRVGISEYAFELLTQFSSLKFSSLKFKIYLKDQPKGDLPAEDENWKYRVIGPRKLWTQIGLPLDLFIHKPKPDIFFSPTHYAPRFSPVPTAVSIMDVSYIHFPELFRKRDLYQLKNWTAYSVKNASIVFTISHFSKNAILEEYKIPEDKIIVTYPGVKKGIDSSKVRLGMDKIKKKYGISNEYILFVGTLQPRKNIVRLIEAFKEIIKDKEKLQLIIIGKKGWLYDEILKAPKKYNIENNVKFLDFVTNEDLSSFYQNATCFVFPSLYEGFGLPILEAMQYDCPVITSNVSSLPEVGGEAVLYIDPLSSSDIAAKIRMIINDPKLRKELIEKGKKQVAKFSWEKTARETLSVLENLVNQKNE